MIIYWKVNNSFKNQVTISLNKEKILMNKLLPIAELIKKLLEIEFKKEAKYTLECKKNWLVNVPDQELYKEFWSEIADIYKSITENKWSLDDVINENSDILKHRNAQMDIWFHEPYNFLCEFDEKQHFNQYRLITLENGYDNLEISFDYNHYHELSSNRIAKPGKSGFDKLKSKDMLFPEMLDGERQDNRIRQRAFRDYLKDIVPIRLGYNPTVRISYNITNNKIKDFAEVDLDSVRMYLYKNSILNKIELK